MFKKGHTTREGKQTAPEKCKQALLDKYKTIIEQCTVERAHDCPLQKFVSEDLIKGVEK